MLSTIEIYTRGVEEHLLDRNIVDWGKAGGWQALFFPHPPDVGFFHPSSIIVGVYARSWWHQ